LRTILALTLALSLATLGLALAAPSAEARVCVIGEAGDDCIITIHCPWDCSCPPDRCCDPECAPP